MDSDGEDTLIGHLEALRQTLLRCLAAVALLFPVGYGVSPAVIDGLVTLCFPEGAAQLNFFSPMEVFLVRLKMGAILAFFGALPWILWQVWRFLLPALYAAERKALGWWIVSATGLFFAGALFCAFFVLPMLVRFAMSFATSTIQPMLGVANVVSLAGWLLLAFGAMFQTPILSYSSLRRFSRRRTSSARLRSPFRRGSCSSWGSGSPPGRSASRKLSPPMKTPPHPLIPPFLDPDPLRPILDMDFSRKTAEMMHLPYHLLPLRFAFSVWLAPLLLSALREITQPSFITDERR